MKKLFLAFALLFAGFASAFTLVELQALTGIISQLSASPTPNPYTISVDTNTINLITTGTLTNYQVVDGSYYPLITFQNPVKRDLLNVQGRLLTSGGTPVSGSVTGEVWTASSGGTKLLTTSDPISSEGIFDLTFSCWWPAAFVVSGTSQKCPSNYGFFKANTKYYLQLTYNNAPLLSTRKEFFVSQVGGGTIYADNLVTDANTFLKDVVLDNLVVKNLYVTNIIALDGGTINFTYSDKVLLPGGLTVAPLTAPYSYGISLWGNRIRLVDYPGWKSLYFGDTSARPNADINRAYFYTPTYFMEGASTSSADFSVGGDLVLGGNVILNGDSIHQWSDLSQYVGGGTSGDYVKKTGDEMTGTLTINTPGSDALLVDGKSLFMNNITLQGIDPSEVSTAKTYANAKLAHRNDACAADLDGNGQVGVGDITPIGAYYGKASTDDSCVVAGVPGKYIGVLSDGVSKSCAIYDADRMGEVGISDLTVLSTYWLQSCSLTVPAAPSKREFLVEGTSILNGLVETRGPIVGPKSSGSSYNPVNIPKLSSGKVEAGNIIAKIPTTSGMSAKCVVVDVKLLDGNGPCPSGYYWTSTYLPQKGVTLCMQKSCSDSEQN
ncbi:MAG: hypothetical protein V1717_00485 [Candidatus Micrarchaeota archaeon]